MSELMFPKTKCSAISPNYTATSKCKNCRKIFNTLPSRVRDPRRGKFCSRACWLGWWKAKKITLTCANCRKEFERSAPQHRHKQLQRGQRRHFCSIICHGAYRSGPDSWAKRMPETMALYSKLAHKSWAREGLKVEPACACCGEAKRRRARDHIVSVAVLLLAGVETAKAYTVENGMTLCASHHGIKTGADGLLFKGDKMGFLSRLRENGFPMDRVHKALLFYGFEKENTLLVV